MRAIVVTVLAALALLIAAPAQAAVPTYTQGDEWGLYPEPHKVTYSCDTGDRFVRFEFTHGKEFVTKVRRSRTGVTLSLRAGDPQKYDSAVGGRITCKDLA